MIQFVFTPYSPDYLELGSVDIEGYSSYFAFLFHPTGDRIEIIKLSF